MPSWVSEFRIAALGGALLLAGCGGLVTAPSPGLVPPASPAPVATQSGSITVSPQYAALGAGGSEPFQASGASGAGVQWLVNGVAGGNATVGMVDPSGNYVAPAELAASMNVVVTAQLTSSPQNNFATAVVSLIETGTVFATSNPQVASYVIYLPGPGNVYIEFGPATTYGLPTWVQATPSPNGGQVTILVAGMRANTPYHMRARVTLADSATFTDSDHLFTTGTPPMGAAVTVTTTAGAVPQPGIELFDTLVPHESTQAFATDLQGNVIWTYSYPGPTVDLVQPLKLLPNGHFLVLVSYASSLVQKGGQIPSGTLDEVREVDLAGNTIRSVTEAQVASALQAMGYSLRVGSFHHDMLSLPNGHLLLLCSEYKDFIGLVGRPGTTTVLGDALVDVDQNFNPDWVWSSFDYLDVNRHPMLFPDWTHSNALLYSAADHNILLSVRHQNWILKIDFQDGTGSGKVLWRLGEGGDFQLQGGVDPTDWFYAQHGPSFFGPGTSGVFELGIMDDGDDRLFPPGVLCGVGGAAPCHYTTAPMLQVDEAARTATLVGHYVPPASMYSFFGGNVDLLGNGDVEIDLAAPKGGSVVQEVKGSGTQWQVVWQAVTPFSNQYRVLRMPSLYPGVQW